MDINWLSLVGSIGLNLLDFLMLYLVTCGLLGLKTIEGMKRFTASSLGFAMGYGLVLGAILYLGQGFMFQSLLVIAMILSIRVTAKNLKIQMNFIDSVIAYFLLYIGIHVVMFPILLLVSQFGLSEWLNNFAIYLATVFILCLICQFFELDRLFRLVTKSFLIKIIIFFLFSMFVVTFIILNFKMEQVIESMSLFIILVVIATNCLYYIFKHAHEYMNVMPEKYHDTSKILMLLNDKMQEADDIDEIKISYQKAMTLMGIEAVPRMEITTEARNDFEVFILKTISYIRQVNGNTAKILHNIDYESTHPDVDELIIAYLLGSLLENAIQTMTHKPIYIHIMSSEHFVAIKVSNEAKHKQQAELDSMLKRGVSSKGKIGRGFGLAKLKQAVRKYKGTISITQEANHKENANYLSVLIKF